MYASLTMSARFACVKCLGYFYFVNVNNNTYRANFGNVFT